LLLVKESCRVTTRLEATLSKTGRRTGTEQGRALGTVGFGYWIPLDTFSSQQELPTSVRNHSPESLLERGIHHLLQSFGAGKNDTTTRRGNQIDREEVLFRFFWLDMAREKEAAVVLDTSLLNSRDFNACFQTLAS
jgi:hypothetical protein